MGNGLLRSKSREARIKARLFHMDTIQYCATRSGLRAVLCGFYSSDYGPFYVGARYLPDDGYQSVGARSCNRL